MFRNDLLWRQAYQAPLIVLIPGGTGTQRSRMPGYPAMAAWFWLHGYHAYIAETAGQDGHPGAFSLQRCHDECKAAIEALFAELEINGIILFGHCSGGTIAVHLAATFPLQGLILYETLPHYAPESRLDFVSRTKAIVAISEKFMDEYLETAEATQYISCPMLLLHGDISYDSAFNLTHKDRLLEKLVSTPSIHVRHINGGDHSFPRGTQPMLLKEMLLHVASFVDELTTKQEERNQP